MSETLQSVPNAVVGQDGGPRFGTYRGELPAVKFDKLSGEYRPKWWQWKIRRKRWHYTIVATDEILICQACVDGGYFGQAFVYAVDLYEQKPVLDRRFVAVPGLQLTVNDRPGIGHRSSYHGPGVRVGTERGESDDFYRWRGHLHPMRQGHRAGMELAAELDVSNAAPALTVLSPVDGGLVNVTQKWAGLETSGRFRIGSRSYRLDGGLAGLDYTQGILGRRTCWRWAHALGRLSDGRPVGINLVAGFNDGDHKSNENAMWIGDRLIPLGRAEFDYDPEDPERMWTITTDCGAVHLHFDAYFVFREERHWKVIDSSFVQPAGRFEGTLRIDGQRRDVTLFGVTEDQDVYW